MKAARTVVHAALATVIFLAWPFAWLIRDGLGPDATDSHGFVALGRAAMTFRVGPITAVLIVLAVLLRRRAKHAMAREHASTTDTSHGNV